MLKGDSNVNIHNAITRLYAYINQYLRCGEKKQTDMGTDEYPCPFL